MRTLQERAYDWGKTYGHDMAQRQANRMRGAFGVTAFFTDKELEMNANVSSRSEALDHRILDAEYSAWQQVFVAAYTNAYQSYVAEWSRLQERKSGLCNDCMMTGCDFSIVGEDDDFFYIVPNALYPTDKLNKSEWRLSGMEIERRREEAKQPA